MAARVAYASDDAPAALNQPAAGGTLTSEQVAAVTIPDGAPPLSSFAPVVQLACFHLAQDLARSATGEMVVLQADDMQCPYLGYFLFPDGAPST